MNWEFFKKYYLPIKELGFAMDVSLMDFLDADIAKMTPAIDAALASMQALENGAIANPDENRMVGHYWLRAPKTAPSSDITEVIESTVVNIKQFADKIHGGEIKGQSGPFTHLLIIGIGGSALGPQFVSQALGHPATDKMTLHFFDNTDPDGIDLALAKLKNALGQTLVVVISKSGSTPETRNGMKEAEEAFRNASLDFAKHAVAITGDDSKLFQYATSEGWLGTFPMWDWVGGRTSVTGAVGLLPSALQGIDIDQLLIGAAAMDTVTRRPAALKNPAALLALMWYFATDGKGAKDMVILPYKDRLALFSKYLQQLVMESLGKEKDLEGNTVNQGIAVYGNKGSTDQHAYVQQLRDGIPNFFATFIEVKRDRKGASIAVEDDFTSGDFLKGFMLGTRAALHENGRQSITLTIDEVTPFSVGMLIALYERAVGLYASLVGVNAYHQPGVEAGKKAAATFLELNQKIMIALKQNPGTPYTADSMASHLNLETETEIIFKLLEHLAANPDKNVCKNDADVFHETTYCIKN